MSDRSDGWMTGLAILFAAGLWTGVNCWVGIAGFAAMLALRVVSGELITTIRNRKS